MICLVICVVEHGPSDMLVNACCHLPVLDPQPTTECRKSGPDLSAGREALGTRLDSLRRMTHRGEGRSRDPPASAGWATDVLELASTALVLVHLSRHSVPIYPSIWVGPVPQAVAVRRLAVHECLGCRPWEIQGRGLGMPQKGFKLVPPSCSGMISFGQLDVLVKRPAGRSRGGETERLDNAQGGTRLECSTAGAGWPVLAGAAYLRWNVHDTRYLPSLLIRYTEAFNEERKAGEEEAIDHTKIVREQNRTRP